MLGRLPNEAMEKSVLVIEDDLELVDLLKFHLEDHGYKTILAQDGQSGLDAAHNSSVDLIILDIMLPNLDGFEVCKQIRRESANVPILILTAKQEEFDKVLGLELGADDYMTKPFGIRELIARIRALLRRSGREPPENPREKISFPGLELELAKRKVLKEGVEVELTAKEFDLLAFFANHPGVAYNREQLLSNIWGYSYSGYDHTVNSHINRLRAKIEHDPSNPRFIKTVWGVGYRFAEQEDLTP